MTNWVDILPWMVLALIGLGGSALFSGLETGIYSLNPIQLHVRSTLNEWRAQRLKRLVDRPNRLLGTLLISNNIVNYLASFSIGVMLTKWGYEDWTQIMINTAILTPLLLVFGEVLPKDLFRCYSDRLVYLFATILTWITWLLSAIGLLPLVNGMSWFVQRLVTQSDQTAHRTTPRRVMRYLIQEGAGQGLMTPYQSDIAHRILQMSKLTVGDVRIERSQVVTIEAEAPIEQIWTMANRLPHTRLPVVDPSEQWLGLVDTNEVMTAGLADSVTVSSSATSCARDHLTSVVAFSEERPLLDVLRYFQQHRLSMAWVVRRSDQVENAPPVRSIDQEHNDEQGGASMPADIALREVASRQIVGIVTIKDLIEPVIGDLSVW